jgi:Uma2 family endonuclease
MSAVPKIPPLENGDRLTRAEFERRYNAMPHIKKAELIGGVVYMPSPIRLESHGTPHAALLAWLGGFWARTPGVSVADNATVRLDDDNEPQPDAFLYILPTHGGQARVDDDDYLEGAPDLAGEVSASSASIDLHAKLRVYQRHGVREYIVWRVFDQEIDWFVHRNDRFERLAVGSDGIYRSEIFPGLWLDPAAMTTSNMTTVLDVLQRGFDSPEHAAFVAALQKRQQP